MPCKLWKRFLRSNTDLPLSEYFYTGRSSSINTSLIVIAEQCDHALAECLQAEYILSVDQQQLVLFSQYKNIPILFNTGSKKFSNLLQADPKQQ